MEGMRKERLGRCVWYLRQVQGEEVRENFVWKTETGGTGCGAAGRCKMGQGLDVKYIGLEWDWAGLG